jgi:hypothetical protein
MPRAKPNTVVICEHCQPLRHETNVLVLARLQKLGQLADVNLGLAVACSIYFATEMVLLLVQLWPDKHVVPGNTFHTLEMGATFFFSMTELLILLYSPERNFSSPALLRVLMFFGVCSTFVALLLILLNRAEFEILAHNIDFTNDFTIALVDSLLVSTVVRVPLFHPGRNVAQTRGKQVGSWVQRYGRQLAVAATLVPLTMSFVQALVYNFLGVDARGHLLGERPAHILEFIFDGIGAGISFWFCLDSKALVDELTRQIMLAPDDLVVVIDPESNTSVHAAEELSAQRSPSSRLGSRCDSFSRLDSSPCCDSAHSHSHGHTHTHTHCHPVPPQLVPLTELLLPPDATSGNGN